MPAGEGTKQGKKRLEHRGLNPHARTPSRPSYDDTRKQKKHVEDLDYHGIEILAAREKKKQARKRECAPRSSYPRAPLCSYAATSTSWLWGWGGGINKQGKKRRVRHGMVLMPSCHPCTSAAILGEKALKRRTLAAVFLIITMMWRRRRTAWVYGRSLPCCVRGALPPPTSLDRLSTEKDRVR